MLEKNGPDPKMSLILEEELHEIQRIWRMEQGDWENSVYQIYEELNRAHSDIEMNAYNKIVFLDLALKIIKLIKK